MKTFVTKVFSKYYDSGLLGIVHHGDYSNHPGIGQVLQNEFNCSTIGCGFSIAPTHAGHLTTA